MTAAWSASLDTAFQSLGYTVVLSVWSTTLLALFAWTFTKTQRGTSPSTRHRVAFAALLCGAAAGAVFWWPLLAHPDSYAALPIAAAGEAAAKFQVGNTVPFSPPLPAANTVSGVQVRTTMWAGWIAAAWAAIVGLLLVRFVLAIASTWWIRYRATPLDSGIVADAARRLAQRLGYPEKVTVVESSQIEYPAATGWRRPSLIVPCGLDITLSPEHLDPVIAHELAHLRGGDQRIAGVQALVEALLFFSPGARWLSHLAREAREQRCDDVAVEICGDPKAYATALGVLATRASGGWLNAVMGVQAPSLASRIKRILRGDPMQRMNRVQALGLALAVVVTIGSGAIVLAVSYEAMRAVGTTRADIHQAPGGSVPNAVPTGFLMSQHGAPLSVTTATGDGDYCFTRVTVRNVSEKPVASASFAAIVEYPKRSHPAIAVKADHIPIVLEPGATGEVRVPILPVQDVLQWKATRGTQAQALIGLTEVVFTDGNRWAITPPPNAVSHEEYFLLPVAEVSRSLIASPDQPRQAGAACRDDRGLQYSPGAVVRIRGEAGTVVCRDGAWDEQTLDPRPADTGQQEDLRLDAEISKDGKLLARPQIKGSSGQPMTITLDQDKMTLTLVPTRLDAHQVRVDLDTKVGSVAGKTAVVLQDSEVVRATIPGAPPGLDVRLALAR